MRKICRLKNILIFAISKRVAIRFDYRLSVLNLHFDDKQNPTKTCNPFDWGFLFLHTLLNGFQLLPLNDSETSQTKKKQNNKSIEFEIIKVESTPSKKTCSVSLTTSKRILERVLRWRECKTSSENVRLNTYKVGAEAHVTIMLK